MSKIMRILKTKIGQVQVGLPIKDHEIQPADRKMDGQRRLSNRGDRFLTEFLNNDSY